MSNDLWYTLHQLLRAFPLDCHMSESQRVALRTPEVRVKMFDGTIHEKAHWASDLSGESQPAFRGWFIPWGDGYTQIETPEFWSPLK